MAEPVAFEIEDLENEDLIRLIGIFMGHLIIHYGMWFTQASRIIGLESALKCENKIVHRYGLSSIERLWPHIPVDLDKDLPSIMANMSHSELLALIKDIAKNWVAGDGLWFQAIEGSEGMASAKNVNDSCWSIFARLESFKILNFFGVKGNGGLDTLEKALRFRIYSSINAHASEIDSEGNLLFRMTECRVQQARRRKGMEAYCCKSAGITEWMIAFAPQL
ncbi:MAG: DUF6125 family protein [Pseudomonadota bacterium]